MRVASSHRQPSPPHSTAASSPMPAYTVLSQRTPRVSRSINGNSPSRDSDVAMSAPERLHQRTIDEHHQHHDAVVDGVQEKAGVERAGGFVQIREEDAQPRDREKADPVGVEDAE